MRRLSPLLVLLAALGRGVRGRLCSTAMIMLIIASAHMSGYASGRRLPGDRGRPPRSSATTRCGSA